MNNSSFCTVINCMDGRTQLQVNEYLRARNRVDFVDTVTEPGPVRILAEEDEKDQLVQSIFNRTDISVHKHGSSSIAVVAHHDCAGNPVEDSVQKDQALKAAAILKNRYAGASVTALWVGEDWKVQEIQQGAEDGN